MDLTLFVVLLILTLILIALGFYRQEHTELSLVGFMFLFLLSLNLMLGTIQYKIGYDVNTTYDYDCLCCFATESQRENSTGICEEGSIENSTMVMTSSHIENRDVYDTFTAGDTLSHITGWMLAVMSVIGFIGVLAGIRITDLVRRS